MSAVMGGTVVIGLIFILLNIFSDLLYKFFDPRAK
jgi:peptide/nickel transport system permease protein